jgi:Rv2525c-like, glycoside hydrolase-like domain
MFACGPDRRQECRHHPVLHEILQQWWRSYVSPRYVSTQIVLGTRVVRTRADRVSGLLRLLLPLTLVLGFGVGSAHAAAAARTVRYHGYAVTVPRSWPVYDLARHPQTCVRFNRHAVYLGIPGADQSCPADAVGRTEAILIEPLDAGTARAGAGGTGASPGGSSTTFVVGSVGVEVTATWLRDRSLVARALHRPALHASAGVHPPRRALARAASVRAFAAGAVYTGPGFDACYAPSSSQMAAWSSSPYRAIGIYIGGANAACPPSRDPNLTSAWLGNEATAGWHFIPTYVGLQAPSNSCGCAGINPSRASAQGTAAAEDAVSQAQNLGIPAGNPIYDDMEYYPRNSTNTSAVLAFLSGWTSQLHASGYLSGVYGNADSAITDLVNQYGTGYTEPDDIWFADWNGQQTTSDPYVPSSDWANHQRLHQYRGAHNETYGGVTINIDSNYLDSATAGTSGAAPSQAPPPPSLAVSPASDGTTTLTASWAGGSGLSAWRVLAGPSAGSLTSVGGASAHGQTEKFSVRSAAPYFAVQALGSAGQVLANSSTIQAPAHLLLFGRSVFVNLANGVGGVPAGCYLPTTCHVVTTLSVGRITLATTGSESLPATGAGLLFFKLTPQGRRLLSRAPGARLPVQITAREAGGSTVKASLNLVPFATGRAGPARSLTSSPLVAAVGVTDFVFAHGSGGILAGCTAVYACRISATLSIGRVTVAATAPELVAGDELGYVFFSLTPQGRAMLARAPGNQLGASLLLRFGTSVARARIALVQFS